MDCIESGEELSREVRMLVRSLKAWSKSHPVDEKDGGEPNVDPEPLPEASDEEPADDAGVEAAETYLFPDAWEEPDL